MASKVSTQSLQLLWLRLCLDYCLQNALSIMRCLAQMLEPPGMRKPPQSQGVPSSVPHISANGCVSCWYLSPQGQLLCNFIGRTETIDPWQLWLHEPMQSLNLIGWYGTIHGAGLKDILKFPGFLLMGCIVGVIRMRNAAHQTSRKLNVQAFSAKICSTQQLGTLCIKVIASKTAKLPKNVRKTLVFVVKSTPAMANLWKHHVEVVCSQVLRMI